MIINAVGVQTPPDFSKTRAQPTAREYMFAYDHFGHIYIIYAFGS
jgi:hypothetical protein